MLTGEPLISAVVTGGELACLGDRKPVVIELRLVQLGDAQSMPDGPGGMLRYIGNGRRVRHGKRFSVTAQPHRTSSPTIRPQTYYRRPPSVNDAPLSGLPRGAVLVRAADSGDPPQLEAVQNRAHQQQLADQIEPGDEHQEEQ